MTQTASSGISVPGFVSTDLSQFDSAQNRYSFQVAENSAAGTVIGRIRFDGGVTGQALYTLIGPDTDKVALQPDGTLILRAGAVLDFEAGEEVRTLHIEITAIFFGSDGSVAYAETQGTSVTITDVNEAPELTIGGSQNADIPEGTSVAGDTGYTVTSTDPDAEDSVTYTLNDDRFEIVEGKLKVKAGKNFDFETEPAIEVTITATDQSGLTDQETVSITIGDVNERPFLALRGTQTLVLREGTSTGAENLGIMVIAADPDGDDLIFTVSDDRFDVQNGQLVVRQNQTFDFESEPSITLTVTARDPGGLEFAQTVSIAITNVNEPPVLSVTGNQTLQLDEGQSVASETGIMVATTDPDAGDSITYSLSDARFEITDGKLKVKDGQTFDFESEPTIELTVTATDSGGLSDSQTVTVTVTDVNEPPIITLGGSQTLELREGISAAGDTGFAVSATDPDEDDSVTFGVDDDRFEITDGKLRVKDGKSFDFESEPTVNVVLTATDAAGLSSSTTASVSVTNVNEAPVLTVGGSQTLTLNEGDSVGADTGFTVSATDPDADDVVTLSVDDDRFEITDGKLRIKDDYRIDFESEPAIDLVITATDKGGLTDTQSITIAVTDVNEPPVVTIAGSQTLALNEGISVAGDTGFTVSATDPDAGDSVTLSVDDNRFEIVNGALQVKDGQSFDFESEPTIEVTITGTDTGGLTHTGTVTIAVTDVPEAPVVTLSGAQTLTLREGSSTAADTGIIVSAVDGDGDDVTFTTSDDRFEVVGGKLRVKDGKSFDFETEPTVELTITGTDPGGLSHSQTTTIAVTDVNEPPYLVDGNGDVLPAPTVDVAENQAGAVVLALNARDPEGDAPIRFFLRSNREKFTIDNNVLKLRDDVALDFEATEGPETVDIVLLTTPSGRPSFETVRITVNVTDVNEAPELTIAGSQTLDLAEGFSEAADTGFMVSATDPDAGDSVTLSANDDRFEIVNGALRVKADQSFDFETEPAVEVTITATDRSGLTDTQTVSITITDVEPEGNQAPAMLVSGSQTLVLNEGSSVAGATGFTVSATDPNRDDVTFSVDDDRFEMVSGALRVKANQSFDFESEPSIEVTITASDPGGLTDSQTVTVTVTDVNEAPTVSISGSQTLTLNEGTSVAGDTGFTVSATDPDSGDSVSFSVDDNRFEVVNGALKVKADQSFDFEREPSVDLVITGTDQGGLTHSQSVTIAISNVNEAPTVSASGSQTLQINEGISVAGDTGLTFGATDPDAGDIVTLTVDDDRFELVNGALRVKADQSFDFESEPTVDLVITGTDQGGLTDSQAVTVAITNVNEAPTISVNGSQTLQLNEGTSVAGDTGFTVSAADPDQGDSVEFSVDDTRFEIVNGALRVKADQSFDFEGEPSIDLVITATDQGELTDSQTVTVAITNVNEAPTVSVAGSQTLQIDEGISVAGDTGFSFTATDPDAGDSVEFSVDDDRFEIANGSLRVKAGQSFDFESEPSVEVSITGTDQGGLSHSQTVTIAITDVPETPHPIAIDGSQTLTLNEGTSVAGDTGLVVSTTDPDADDSVTLSVDDDRFEIVNGALRVKADQSFDFETEPSVALTITATDSTGLSVSKNVSIEVTDVNEAPTVSVAGIQTLQLDEGTSVAGDTGFTVSATDPDAGDSVKLTVDDNRFEIANGALRVKAGQSFDFESEPSIDLVITGTDQGGHTHTQSVTVAVTDVNEAPTVSVAGSQTLRLNEGTSVAGDTGFIINTADPDDGDSVSFSIDDSRFEIVGTALRVKAGQSFDFETEPSIDLTITGTDQGGLTHTQTVTISISNVNERPTVEVNGSQTLTLNEGTSVAGDTGFTVSATDPDANDSVTFAVDDSRFELVNGALRVKAGQSFDFEAEPRVALVITGTDQGGLTHTQSVTIAVTDVNEAPTVSVAGSQTLQIDEGISVAGDTGFSFTASDPDAGDTVTLTVDDDRFELVNGALRVKAGQSFDFEAEPSVALVITGTDQGGLTHTQSVTIAVTDVNEAPTVSKVGVQTLRLNEGTSVAGDTGFSFTASDPDANDSVTFAVSDDRFEIVNGALRVKAGQSFDFESEPSVDLTITGTDRGGLTDSQTMTVAISNVNEAPTVSVNGSQTLQLNEGTSVAGDTGFTFSATDPDAGDSVSFGVDDNRFEIVNGALRVKAGQGFDFETEPTVDLVITGTDEGGLTDTQSVTIAITDIEEAPVVTIGGRQTLTLREGTSTGEATGYRLTTFDSDGDNVSLTVDDARFEIVGGSLRVKAGAKFNHRLETIVDLMITGTDDSPAALSHTVNLSLDVTGSPGILFPRYGEDPVLDRISPSELSGNRLVFDLAVDEVWHRIENGDTLLLGYDRTTDQILQAVTLTGHTAPFTAALLQDPNLKLRQAFVGTTDSDTLTGTSRDDYMFGDARDDTLEGLAGRDRKDGGEGSDTASYASSTAAVTVNLNTGLHYGGHATGDILKNIENVTGSRYGDDLTGDANANTLTGGAGDDRMAGLAGADIMDGGAGRDTVNYYVSTGAVNVDLTRTGPQSGGHAEGDVIRNVEVLIGSRYDDTLKGNAEDNTFNGAGGADIIDGHGGDNTVSYVNSGSGVTVNLGGPKDSNGYITASGGHAEGDKLKNIENLRGSRYDDILTGDDGNNLFVGAQGGDRINGGDGFDTVSYATSNAAVNVDLTRTGAQSGGDAQGDILSGIENVEGSRYSDTLKGDAHSNLFTGGRGRDDIDGRGGRDWVNYSTSLSRVNVDLQRSTQQDGDAQGDTLRNIENIAGSAFNDVLKGDGNSNSLRGRAGADIMDGRGGRDTAYYTDSDAGVAVNLQTGRGSGGHAEGDRLSNIESLYGSRYDDTLTGDSGNNVFVGGAGADTITGGGGIDTASYATSARGVTVDLSRTVQVRQNSDASEDRLSGIRNLEGSDLDDTLKGDTQNNVIVGGGGADTINGGIYENNGLFPDSDTASYISSAGGVTVNLHTNVNTGHDAEGDRLFNIENLQGSNHNDRLTGNAKVNIIYGEGGNDHLYGLGGNDRLYGEAGNDHLYGGDGGDRLDGGTGADILNGGAGADFVSYLSAARTSFSGNRGVNVNLATGRGRWGEAEGDTYLSIENVIGSRFNDTITGNRGRNLLFGLEGADTIDGGDGTDTVSYVDSDAAVTVNLATGIGRGGDAEGDRLSNIEHVFGSDHGDTLTGDAEDNLFLGGEGGDTINGGGGTDTVSYITSGSGVTIDLSAAAGSRASGGDAEGDRLTSIESIEGSNHGDRLTSNSGNNQVTLRGGGGNDRLTGKALFTSMYGGDGNDTLVSDGGRFAMMFGGQGQDTLIGQNNVTSRQAFGFRDGEEASSTRTADMVEGFNQGIDIIYLRGISNVFYRNADVTGDGTTDTTLYADRGKTKVIAVLKSVNVDLVAQDFDISRMITNLRSSVNSIDEVASSAGETVHRLVTPEESREFQDAVLAYLQGDTYRDEDISSYLTVTEIA